MSKKILISLTDEQADAMDKLMDRALVSNKSAFIASLIGRAWQEHLADVTRRPPGRPRKVAGPSDDDTDADAYEDAPDYAHDMPKNIMHFGRMIGPRELADIERVSGEFKPQ